MGLLDFIPGGGSSSSPSPAPPSASSSGGRNNSTNKGAQAGNSVPGLGRINPNILPGAQANSMNATAAAAAAASGGGSGGSNGSNKNDKVRQTFHEELSFLLCLPHSRRDLVYEYIPTRSHHHLSNSMICYSKSPIVTSSYTLFSSHEHVMRTRYPFCFVVSPVTYH